MSTSEFINFHCAVPYCGQLLARVAPGSEVETKCNRCYALTLWKDGKTRLTRPPKRARSPAGKWYAIEDFDEIDRIMRQRRAVEGVDVRSPRGGGPH